MSECIYDMTALSHLRDSIVDIIKYDKNPELQHAKNLLCRIDERKLEIWKLREKIKHCKEGR